MTAAFDKPFPLRKAVHFFVGQQGPPSLRTIQKWATQGLIRHKGEGVVKLETWFDGGTLVTDAEAIERFKKAMHQHFVCFDPGDVDEFLIYTAGEKAQQEGRATVEVPAGDGVVTLKTSDVMQIAGDIMGQIYARDFKMIDQSEMIVSLVPELPSGKPALSSGVERELQHAFEGGKEVYVVWMCRAMPSPFVTETATKVFKSTGEAVEYFGMKGYLK
jgi:hypothetical protein